ncbi:SDR family oxidoreductase [Lentzea sp. NPDC003310]|uniref:SDR family oxidoreductase n=1 Tax=Lentzea sp. NPDC003310 TaxID=3154447 RepID=UPI0033A1D9BB
MRVLVIGRSGGIAGAVADGIRAAGGTVVLAGRNQDEHVDLTDEGSIAALAERVGNVDHVVSTASARARGTAADLDRDAVRASFDVKVIGSILLARHFAPRLPRTGSFVFLSGASARRVVPGMLAVGATNAAVDAVTRSLAVELAPIRVNAVSPGTVDTGAYDALGAERKAALFASREATSPAGRVGRADEIAGAVLFLLTNGFTTGVTLGVDGGEVLV